MYILVFFVIIFTNVPTKLAEESSKNGATLDLLLPYEQSHGPTHDNQYVRSCQQIKYGNRTHSLFPIYQNNSSAVGLQLPLVKSRFLMKKIGEENHRRNIAVYYQLVTNPWHTLSVLEPKEENGCDKVGSGITATVEESAKQMNCLVAVNAGFFNRHTGECFGNIVSNERLVKDSEGIQNAHFGITKDGNIYTGYLSEIDIVAQDFVQLVGGVIWLIRDGEIHINDSMKMECSEAQETGNFQRFVDVISARTAVGHDKNGQVIIVQVGGETDQRGVNLYELAKLLLEFGAVNAINLDGGGSTSLVINGTLVSQPSDMCPDNIFRCVREVSTILCVHEPLCDPPDCNGHGLCVLGLCACSNFWTGAKCDLLKCEKDCNHHGQCTKDGCKCSAGWWGKDCSKSCSLGKYGQDCNQVCFCQNNSTCDSISGNCTCPPGYIGDACQNRCPYGYYGDRCQHLCLCPTDCGCDHVTGSCNSTSTYTSNMEMAGKCIARQIIKTEHLVVDKSDEYKFYVHGFILMSIIAGVSIIANLYCSYCWWKDCLKSKISGHRSILQNDTMTTNSLLNHSYISDYDEEDDDDHDRDYLSSKMKDEENVL